MSWVKKVETNGEKQFEKMGYEEHHTPLDVHLFIKNSKEYRELIEITNDVVTVTGYRKSRQTRDEGGGFVTSPVSEFIFPEETEAIIQIIVERG